jgi:hypothetical protein
MGEEGWMDCRASMRALEREKIVAPVENRTKITEFKVTFKKISYEQTNSLGTKINLNCI